MNIIEPLKEFFGYDVPLGVCIIVALGAYYFVFKLQEERRKDYKTTFNSQAKVIEELNKIEIRELTIQKKCFIIKGGRIIWVQFYF